MSAAVFFETLAPFCLSDSGGRMGTPVSSIWRTGDVLLADEDVRIFNIDSGVTDPSLCPDIANDLMLNLKSIEWQERPRTDYMEKVQRCIKPMTRAFCVDWLVYAAEELCLVPETLHLGVCCLDRCLSGNIVDPKNLRVAALSCLMISAKCLEIKGSFRLSAYINLTRGMLSRKDYTRMEMSMLRYFDYKVHMPTAWTFLDRFVRAAHGGKKTPLQGLGSMACYLAELSLLSCAMLPFRPSMVAASCVFLAQYVLCPLKKPWNATFEHYTQYQPCDLRDCIMALHTFCYQYQICTAGMPNVRIKYSRKEYDRVALKIFPAFIPYKLFEN